MLNVFLQGVTEDDDVIDYSAVRSGQSLKCLLHSSVVVLRYRGYPIRGPLEGESAEGSGEGGKKPALICEKALVVSFGSVYYREPLSVLPRDRGH